MGTRLVYDYQQQKWIPYVSDPDKWYQHLLDVRDGYAERDSHGHYIVGSGRKYRELKEMKSLESKMETQRPVFNLVSPVAQATEMAKSEIKRDRKKDGKRKKEAIPPPSLKRKYRRRPEDSKMSDWYREQLALFVEAPRDSSLKSKEWIEYKPTNQINDTSAINFTITAQSSAYVDLKNSVLNVKLRLTDGDGTPLNKDEVVGLVNAPLHSIFRQVDVTFQQTPLSHSGNNYPYKAYIDTILKTNEIDQTGILTSQLFYKDNGQDTSDAKTGSNSGLFARCTATLGGKIVDLEGPLLIDVFQQPRLLLNGIGIGIKLWPSLDAFRLMSDSLSPSEKVQIVDASFKLCVQRLDEGLIVSNEKMLKIQPAIYPYLRSEIKTTSIPSGQYSFSADDIFQSLVPCQLIVGLVASASYMGDYKKSPYYFRDYDCSSVGFYLDGQSYPSQPLRPNYEADQYVDCYRTLTCFRKDINVKRNDYVKGYCLYALEIDPYYSFNVKRQGHCRLEMKFAKPLPESATLILYATFPEILNIDSSRSVFVR